MGRTTDDLPIRICSASDACFHLRSDPKCRSSYGGEQPLIRVDRIKGESMAYLLGQVPSAEPMRLH